MMNNRWIMVFDLETDAPNPQTCNAVELAAVPVNPRTLEIKAEQALEQQLNQMILTKKNTSQRLVKTQSLGTQKLVE